MTDDLVDSEVRTWTDRDTAPIGDIITELAADLLETGCCEFLVQKDDQLIVRSRHPQQPSDLNDSYSLWSSIPGNAYSSGRACVIDDTADTRSSTTHSTPTESGNGRFRSLCCIPIDPDAMLLAKAKLPDSFSEQDRTRLERLAQLSEHALETFVKKTIVSDGGPAAGRDYAAQLEEIADILSHDLMNPLSVVEGNIELAQETGNIDHLEQAASALSRVIELIDEVVFLARTGDLIEATESIELRDHAESAWENVQTEEANLEITDSLTFQASSRAVRHLLENLFDNAVTHAGSRVTVRIGRLDDGFYIEDDGPGIPKDHREQIFERGFSIEAGSSGLGLHIVNRIADAHGWDVEVAEASRGGARFEVIGLIEKPS